jgi:hypothetical protein
MQGLPQRILQAMMAVCGTVKAVVLVGDPACPNLLATSVYDTRPVHFLSTVGENIKWMVKEPLVCDVETMKMETMQNDLYYNSMEDVDVSDQLQSQYRFDHWLQMCKWWWSILLWWAGVMLVNAYIFYRKIKINSVVHPSWLLSHHDF